VKIEIFGPGCPRCHATEKIVINVLAELNLAAEVVKVTDINAMVDRGVMFTPAVIIDGKKVCEGKIPTAQMVKEWLK